MNFKLSYILNICGLDKLMYENNVTNIINSKKNSENNSHIYELIYSLILISGLIGVSIAFIRKVYMSSTKIELNKDLVINLPAPKRTGTIFTHDLEDINRCLVGRRKCYIDDPLDNL